MDSSSDLNGAVDLTLLIYYRSGMRVFSVTSMVDAILCIALELANLRVPMRVGELT